MSETVPPSRSQGVLLSRRAFVAMAPFALAACSAAGPKPSPEAAADFGLDQSYAMMYGPITDEPFPIAAIDVRKIDPRYLRQVVSDPTGEMPGTVVVDPQDHFLYLVQSGGMALRYGVGVGREGFGWSGRATVARKAEWPWWYPPKEMVARDPKAAPWANGMPGGIENPLGARALYLYQGKKDTLYRIHGTTEPWSIGKSVSSGCIRMFNHDVIDLHRRVPVGTNVLVMGGAQPAPVEEEPMVGEGAAPGDEPVVVGSVMAPL